MQYQQYIGGGKSSARENFFLKKHNKREAIDLHHFPLAL